MQVVLVTTVELAREQAMEPAVAEDTGERIEAGVPLRVLQTFERRSQQLTEFSQDLEVALREGVGLVATHVQRAVHGAVGNHRRDHVAAQALRAHLLAEHVFLGDLVATDARAVQHDPADDVVFFEGNDDVVADRQSELLVDVAQADRRVLGMQVRHAGAVVAEDAAQLARHQTEGGVQFGAGVDVAGSLDDVQEQQFVAQEGALPRLPAALELAQPDGVVPVLQALPTRPVRDQDLVQLRRRQRRLHRGTGLTQRDDGHTREALRHLQQGVQESQLFETHDLGEEVVAEGRQAHALGGIPGCLAPAGFFDFAKDTNDVRSVGERGQVPALARLLERLVNPLGGFLKPTIALLLADLTQGLLGFGVLDDQKPDGGLVGKAGSRSCRTQNAIQALLCDRFRAELFHECTRAEGVSQVHRNSGGRGSL